ncbi:MAG: hypothetical protein NT012_01550 [Candidatus Nealsonbacteria bacterium]|nr:hypothetical protein [Candidatus Nealsonbacteria bacterium]
MQNYFKKFEFFVVFFTILFFTFSLATPAFAVKLYLEPSQGEYRPGETFIEEIKIDTEGECINVVEANLSFSQNILKVVDFSTGESILTLWVKTPTIDQNSGTISFIGGIPGEYCGRIPGDPGPSNLLGKIIFKIPGVIVGESKDNMVEVKFLDTSQVLLSDKMGTKAKLTIQGAIFKILSEPGISKDEWQEIIKRDNIPPEPFEIEVHQDHSVFENKYFIVFSTTDKQTGIDYFEVKEGKKDWKKAISPYLLEDQRLESIIKVRAVDKAGNERMVEYMPLVKIKPLPCRIIIAIVVGLTILLLIIWIILKLKRNRAKNKPHEQKI